MCGICGIVNRNREEPVAPGLLSAMARTMTHRGPDDEGFHVAGPVGLGHRRLSIIDLQTGRQPIHNEDQTVWIVFNGEIYNAPDLRSSLEQAGHRFHTQSDTETIVHAYEQYGTDCLQRLNGMFAFAIWDAPRERLFLARDRAGIKPLYYADLPGCFLFGSELKAILRHPDVERDLDIVALNQYLLHEYVPTPRTIIEGVRKLPPGCSLVLERGLAKIESYWDLRLAESEMIEPRRVEEYVEGIRAAIRESVRLELLSDVPLGVLLSGGLDSSAIAAMMVRLCPGKVHSFSIAFDDPSFDESDHARSVAHHLGTEHHELTVDPASMLDLVPRLSEFMDEPLGDSSIIPTYWLAQFTARHVKVALGGDGGDELFGGYITLQAHKLSEYYRRLVPAWARSRLLPRMVRALPVSFENVSFDFMLRRFILGESEAPAIRHHGWIGSFDSSQRRSLLGERAAACDEAVRELAEGCARASGASEMLNQILYCDTKLYLEGDILPKVDRASMANSLEVRAPLLNPVLLDFAETLPHEMKLHGFSTKYIMRRALEGLVPPAIPRRPKKGFNIPVAKWLTGPLQSLAEDLLDESRLRREGLFNPAYVRGLLDEHLARKRDNRKYLWTLMAFELWYDRWAKKPAGESEPAGN